jgi:trigger factor
MNVTVESASNESASTLRRRVIVDLGREEVAQKLSSAYDELRRTVRLKGFRPGRVPQKLIQRFFGDQVRADVTAQLIREYTDKALKEVGLQPVAAPQIITEQAALADGLRFSAVFDVMPEIALKDYRDLNVTLEAAQPAEQEVEAALLELRQRQATLRKVQGRESVEPGDFVLARLEARVGDKPLPGFGSEPKLIEVSPTALPADLADLLTGAQRNQPFERVMSHPAGHPVAALAGKTVAWSVEVNELFGRELPELDDAFARDLGAYQSVAELRAATRQRLAEQAEAAALSRARLELLDRIVERNPVELPESLVEMELAVLVREREQQAEDREQARQPAADATAIAPERQGELRSQAEKQARRALIVDALARELNVEVSDDELAGRVAEIVRAAGRERQAVADYYAREENRVRLRGAMRREKALDALLRPGGADPPAPSQAPADRPAPAPADPI